MTCGDSEILDERTVTQATAELRTYRATVALKPARVLGTVEVQAPDIHEAMRIIKARIGDENDTFDDMQWKPFEIEAGDLRLLRVDRA